MKKFTLYFVLILLAMNVAGQSKPLLNILAAQQHEALVKLVGESRANTIERVLSHPFPLQLDASEKNANAYVLKLDSTLKISDFAINIWANHSLYVTHYDATWKPVEHIRKDWSFLPPSWEGGWELDYKTTWSYNNHGQLSKEIWYSAKNNNLVDSIRIEPYYNTSGRLDSVLYYEVLTGGTYRYDFTYNEAGLLAGLSLGEYDDSEEMWVEYFFFSLRYIYDEAGKRISSSWYLSDEEEEFLMWETHYFYDGSGRLTHKEESDEDGLYKKFAYVYGSGADISELMVYRWNKEWVEYTRTEFFYNESINYSDVAFPYGFKYPTEEADFSFHKLPIETREYDYGDDSIIASKTAFYYSSTSSTSANAPVQESAGLFPNPATSQISFTWPESNEQLVLEMYQVNGAKVMQQVVSAGSSVPVGHLNRGLYFYRLTDNGKIHAFGKILLQ